MKTILCLLAITNLMFASSSIDVRTDEITAIVLRNKNNICDGNVSSFEIRMKELQPTVICDSKMTQKEIFNIRFNEMKPVIKCNANGICDGMTSTQVRQMNLEPIVICTSTNNCDGINSIDVRRMEILPVAICTKNNECNYHK